MCSAISHSVSFVQNQESAHFGIVHSECSESWIPLPRMLSSADSYLAGERNLNVLVHAAILDASNTICTDGFARF